MISIIFRLVFSVHRDQRHLQRVVIQRSKTQVSQRHTHGAEGVCPDTSSMDTNSAVTSACNKCLDPRYLGLDKVHLGP